MSNVPLCHAKRHFRPQNVPKVPRVPQNGHSSKSSTKTTVRARLLSKQRTFTRTHTILVQNLRTVSAKHARVLVMPGPTHSKDLHDLYTNPPRKSPREGHTLFVQWPCTQRLYNYNRVWFFPTSKASAVLPRECSNTHHVQKNAAIEGPPRAIGFCEQAVSLYNWVRRNILPTSTRLTIATRPPQRRNKQY